MTVVPPQLPPRDSGDAWVEGPDGRRFWGRYGAAGLLVQHDTAGVLLQHRAEWSHFGGTWGLPGGARHEGESAIDGALREAGEEAGVPADQLRIAFTSTLDLGYWSYVTVVARAAAAFTPRIGDAESLELRWVPVDEVDELPLHPGFGAAWPQLRRRLGERVRVVVDAANVIGSRPDGWWKDRAGANRRLLERLTALSALGVDAAELDPEPSRAVGAPDPGPTGSAPDAASLLARSWPRFQVIVEGQARGVSTEARSGDAFPDVRIVRAPASGDDAIVETVAARIAARPGSRVLVVTADRELRDRVQSAGAAVRGPGWLLGLLDAAESDSAAS